MRCDGDGLRGRLRGRWGAVPGRARAGVERTCVRVCVCGRACVRGRCAARHQTANRMVRGQRRSQLRRAAAQRSAVITS